MAGKGKKWKRKDGSKTKKGQEAKKKAIDKLIENSGPTGNGSFSETARPLTQSPEKHKPKVRLAPSTEPQLTSSPSAPKPTSRQQRYTIAPTNQAKPIVPGLPQDLRCHDTDYFMADKRHEIKFEGGLVRLPKEPDVKRTPAFIREGHFQFFDLPAELRNQIYDYLLEPECYAIDWIGDNQKSGMLTYRLPERSKACWPRMSEDTLSRRRTLKINPRDAGRKVLMSDQYRHHSPVALLWVCRKMYVEASSMFYGKSTFVFALLGTLRHFLNTLTANNKASIAKLKLIYKSYGHPARTENQVWKAKHDRAWESLCWRVSNECPSLSHLTLDLDYGRSKLQFVSLEEAKRDVYGTGWMLALWAFQDVNVRRCACRLRSAITFETVLEVESQRIRKGILYDQWNEEAEEGRDGFGFEKPSGNKKQKMAAAILQIAPSGEVIGIA